jgi:acetate kinase
MNVLAVNCGSTSLKFALVNSFEDGRDQRRLAWGTVRELGQAATIDFHSQSGANFNRTRALPDLAAAMKAGIEWLSEAEAGPIDASGHRIVHGGPRFTGPVEVNAGTIKEIEQLEELAPLHNGPALAALRACRELLGERAPAVAVFDTSFHQTIPPRASHYALPLELTQRLAIRRYGFHGLAHEFMLDRFCAIASRARDQVRLITLQLGGGCSIAAISGGRSIDTSMGFTPLEGLMMGTRSGDIDPSLPAFLTEHERIGMAEIERLLNSKSGLLGVSGRSEDVRELLRAESSGDERSALALDMFCYRVRKGIGAYLAVLNGADAVVFGGGIGEWQPAIRERICAGMDWCGLRLDVERNASTKGSEGRISADASGIEIYVIPVDEESIIIRDTVRCLSGP